MTAFHLETTEEKIFQAFRSGDVVNTKFWILMTQRNYRMETRGGFLFKVQNARGHLLWRREPGVDDWLQFKGFRESLNTLVWQDLERLYQSASGVGAHCFLPFPDKSSTPANAT